MLHCECPETDEADLLSSAERILDTIENSVNSDTGLLAGNVGVIGDVRYQIRSLNDDTGEYSLIVSGQKSALDESAGEDTSTRGYTEISGSIDVTSNGTLVPYFGTYN